MFTTYRQLLEALKKLEAEGNEWLDAAVTIKLKTTGEYLGADFKLQDVSDGVIEETYPLLEIDW